MTAEEKQMEQMAGQWTGSCLTFTKSDSTSAAALRIRAPSLFHNKLLLLQKFNSSPYLNKHHTLFPLEIVAAAQPFSHSLLHTTLQRSLVSFLPEHLSRLGPSVPYPLHDYTVQ